MAKRTVTVTGSGRAAVTPDVVRLELRVGHEADDVAEALAGASAGVTRVGAIVRDAGVAGADVRTLDATVSQRWDSAGAAAGFTAQQRLTVTVRRLEAVGEILEAAAAAIGNALLVDQVRLDVSDRTDGLCRARDAAFADARAKAEQYAVLSGGHLGDVLGLAESGATPTVAVRALAASLGPGGGMPVEGGDLDLGAGVTVTWELRGTD